MYVHVHRLVNKVFFWILQSLQRWHRGSKQESNCVVQEVGKGSTGSEECYHGFNVLTFRARVEI